MKKTLSMMLLLTMVLTLLTACGSGSGSGSKDADITGKWDVTKMEDDGEEVDLTILTQMGIEMYMEFSSDGKVTVSMMGETVDGTYKVSGNKADITFEGETQTADIDGNKMTLDIDGEKMTLEKQK